MGIRHGGQAAADNFERLGLASFSGLAFAIFPVGKAGVEVVLLDVGDLLAAVPVGAGLAVAGANAVFRVLENRVESEF